MQTRLQVTVGPVHFFPCVTGLGTPCSPDASTLGDGPTSSTDATLADDGNGDADAGIAEASAPAVIGDCPRAVTSCNGIDGLTPGALLVFDLTHQTTQTAGGCFAYDTTGFSGLPDVTFSTVPRNVAVGGAYVSPFYLATASGEFSSSRSAGCGGGWDLQLYPPGHTEPLSPLEAGPDSGWLIYRRIAIHSLQGCDSAYPAGCASLCEDWFAVDRIVQAP